MCCYLSLSSSFKMFALFTTKGQDCTCGVIVNLEQPAQKNSVIVEVLKKQGAIPFVKTNLPQALLK